MLLFAKKPKITVLKTPYLKTAARWVVNKDPKKITRGDLETLEQRIEEAEGLAPKAEIKLARQILKAMKNKKKEQ